MADLIDRQAAIDAIRSFYDEYIVYDNGKSIEDLISELPSIDPVRHGRWISVGHKRDRICSICDCDEPYKFADEDANVFDYCPHCGARME